MEDEQPHQTAHFLDKKKNEVFKKKKNPVFITAETGPALKPQ